MEIPGIGELRYDHLSGCYTSSPVTVPVLACRHSVLVELSDDDPAPQDFEVAVQNFLVLEPNALLHCAAAVFAYYLDVTADVLAAGDDDWFVEIATEEAVFDHIQLGSAGAVVVRRLSSGDRRVYVSLEFECDWEPEHGLQIGAARRQGRDEGRAIRWTPHQRGRLRR
ncbi:hypothetical protein [Nocardia sp. NPDC051832]|uniref:DUF6985 domain-containing protein n=1 Tax=Nocardia sp. NPDC051832 TaxID=3155673 RepID=UPI0034353952